MKHRSKTFVASAVALAAIIAAAPSQALAQDPIIGVVAKVTFLEATYIPDSITFMIDKPLSASCPAGTLMRYFAQGADATAKAQNIAAVFSLLMTAKSSNQVVTLNSYASDCVKVRFVSLS